MDDFFYTTITPITVKPKPQNKTRLLHVSCFDEQAKNIQGMLRSVRKVAEERQDFELVIIGTGVDYQKNIGYAKTLNFPQEMLHFIGEQTPYEVAQWMQQSDAFIMFSRYENAPVVLSECLAIGLPIISSNAGGIPEMVGTSEGILVPSENETMLSEVISNTLSHIENWDNNKIREKGLQYHQDIIGKQLYQLYLQLLG